MSDNYIVSARKYRPQTFDTVVGQEHITTTLKNAIKNQHLAHAYLFCGPRGVGKTTCARILAKTINCEHPTEDMEACNVCPTCVSFKNNTSFNVFELDAASNNSVDDIRELTNQVRFAPQQGRYKVYIIDEVHMLSAAAFNAFLKTLEEPPPYAIFILATTEKHKILPTILSRCQIFDFKRITTHDIVAHLQSIASKEGMIAQEAALHVIAQKSEGAMRDALSMLDRIASFTNGMLTYSNTMEHLNLLDADYYFRLTDSMLSQDVAGTLLLLDQALEKGFEGDVIINGLAEHFRNLMLCKDARMAKLLDVPNDFRPVYNEKAGQAPPSFILSALNVINDSELQYKSATNKRLHVEICLIRLCYLLQAVKTTEQGTADNAELKKKPLSLDNAPVSAPQQVPNEVKPAIVKETSIAPPATPVQEHMVQEAEASVYKTAPVQPPVYKAVPPVQQPASSGAVPPVQGRYAEKNTRKLTMDMLDITADVSNALANQDNEQKILHPDIGKKLFEDYKQKLKDDNKSAIYAQFTLMRVEVIAPDQVKIISPSELTDTYAKEQKSAMLDFFVEESKMRIRITTEIQIDKDIEKSQINTVLSKSEMYEVMATKNSNLAKLKDGLGMQIEY